MSCIALPPSAANMLTLSQVSLLVSRTSSFSQDDNNNVGCGALALKMMSSRCSAVRTPRAFVAPSGPKRCLFGAPSAADTQRLLRDDQDAVKARMQRRWGWDMSREAPSAAPSSWQWEPVKAGKARRHPYAVRPSATKAAASPVHANTPLPALVSPLPATPTAVLDSSTASSSSGTSTLSPSSPTSPALAHLSSPTVLRRPRTPTTPESSWESESDDSCCGDSGCSSPRPHDAGHHAGLGPHSVPVQTRITDFWRTRRCSTSESIVKTGNASPAPARPQARPPARPCSVSV